MSSRSRRYASKELSASPRSEARYNRNERRIGSVLRVCVGDRELDGRGGGDAFDLPLDKELVVDRAGFVFVEAVFVRVIEPLQREVFATPRIGTIQKRAMM